MVEWSGGLDFTLRLPIWEACGVKARGSRATCEQCEDEPNNVSDHVSTIQHMHFQSKPRVYKAVPDLKDVFMSDHT